MWKKCAKVERFIFVEICRTDKYKNEANNYPTGQDIHKVINDVDKLINKPVESGGKVCKKHCVFILKVLY